MKQTLFITGGASGIGAGVVRTFAGLGVDVFIADRDTVSAEALIASARVVDGARISFKHTDVTQPDQIEAAVAEASELFGRLDYAVNCAGGVFPPYVRLDELSEAAWNDCVSLNLTSVWRSMKFELREMLRRDGGVIVNISSIVGLTGSESRTGGYSPSKHGVIGLTRTAALEYAADGIRVNAVCPGYTRTPAMEEFLRARPDYGAEMTAAHPLGRLAGVEEIAAAVQWLCSPAASFVTGHALPIDGGFLAR